MFTRRIALSRQISEKMEKGKAKAKEKNRDRDKKRVRAFETENQEDGSK